MKLPGGVRREKGSIRPPAETVGAIAPTIRVDGRRAAGRGARPGHGRVRRHDPLLPEAPAAAAAGARRTDRLVRARALGAPGSNPRAPGPGLLAGRHPPAARG